MKHKVMAYVVRPAARGWQLLVFEQAGVQVPAGTVEMGELMEAALWRELMEESGLQAPQVALVGKLAEAPEPDWDLVRHVYLLRAVADLPERWTAIVGGEGGDHGMQFHYYWVDIAPGLRLAGNQYRWLAHISEPLAPHQARS
jgi:8-oxo-dGTP pyrophosphatase MutT (NUDIX family)